MDMANPKPSNFRVSFWVGKVPDALLLVLVHGSKHRTGEDNEQHSGQTPGDYRFWVALHLLSIIEAARRAVSAP
jgi:hypothetical protein